MRLPTSLVSVCLLLSAYTMAYGQEVEKDTIARKVHDLPVIEVQGRKAVSRITTTTGQQTLDRDQIVDLGIRSVADAVKRFAGVVVRDYGGVGGLKTVSVRNMGAAHTAVSYDGIVVSNSQAGQVDIGKFSLANLGNITLTVGQGSDLLQSARMYASAGVLSLQTLLPSFAARERGQMQVQMKGGSFGHLNPYLRYARKVGEQTVIMVDADYVKTEGNYPFTLINGNEVTRERRLNSGVSAFHSEINLSHTRTDASRLDTKLYYYDAKRGLPGSVVLYKQNEPETAWDRVAFVQTRYRHTLSPQWRYQVQAKFNHAWDKYQAEGMQYLGKKKVNTFAQNEYYLSGTVQYTPSEIWSLSMAHDGSVNTLKSNLHDQASPLRITWLAALNARMLYERIKVEGTLLHTYKHERVRHGIRPGDVGRWSPMVSFSIQPFDGTALYLRGMYKSTFRLPTFNDMYYDEMGTRNLDPEIADEYSVGVTYGSSSIAPLCSFAVTLDAYLNEVKDKIVAFPTTFVWKMRNYGRARISGIDVGVSSHWDITDGFKADLSGSFTYQSSHNLTDPKEKSYRHQLPYSPQVFGNVSALLHTPYINVGYTFIGVGKRYVASQNIQANVVEGYGEHSVSLSHTFHLPSCNIRLQADIHNLTDTQYDVVKYYPMPGRSFTFTGSIIY